jgi:hypothetical protein
MVKEKGYMRVDNRHAQLDRVKKTVPTSGVVRVDRFVRVALGPKDETYAVLLKSKQSLLETSFEDPGLNHGSRIQGQKDSGSRIHIEEFKHFHPKNCF